MVKISHRNQKSSANDNTNSSNNKQVAEMKVKKTRKTVPRDAPMQRSSIYRGVTRHRWTGRYEAHLWDKNCWNESQNKKGRQVYLGAYDDEEAAARAYDLAALKYWGPDTILNFSLSVHEEELKEMEGQSREEYIGCLRRKSSGFSRGVSKYRGVARHHHNGRWEARIGRVFGNKYLYLGTYATQEEAATAYDMAAIEYRGINAVTNFDLSRYIKWLRPNYSPDSPNDQNNPVNQETTPNDSINIANIHTQVLNYPCSLSSHPDCGTTVVPPCSGGGAATSTSASSALGLLLQSKKFKEMSERISAADSPPTPLSEYSNSSIRRSIPDDIQTYFDFQEDGNYREDHDDIMTSTIFGDLNSFINISL